MRVGQAFAVAFGLAFAIFGLLYIVWRSDGNDRTASILRVLLTALSVSMWFGSGTFFLLMREPNVLIGTGMGIFAYASAFKRGIICWHYLSHVPRLCTFKTMLQIYSFGNVVAACLCGIGSVVYGGPIGVLGAFVALPWALLHLWLLRRVSLDEASDQISQP